MKALRGTPVLLAFGVVSVLATHPSTPTAMAPSQGDAAKQKAPSIERLDPALDKLLAPDAKIEILAEGYEWSEGPIWVKNGGFLLFSDVLKNTVHQWKTATWTPCRLISRAAFHHVSGFSESIR